MNVCCCPCALLIRMSSHCGDVRMVALFQLCVSLTPPLFCRYLPVSGRSCTDGKAPSPALQRKLEKQAADAAKAAAKAKAEAEQKKRAEEVEARAALYPLPDWESLLLHAKGQALTGAVEPA